jgi:hypothetical protein
VAHGWSHAQAGGRPSQGPQTKGEYEAHPRYLYLLFPFAEQSQFTSNYKKKQRAIASKELHLVLDEA